MKIRELLAAKDRVPRKDREWLLQDLLGINYAELFLREEENITPAQLKKYRGWISKRRKGVPLQYIVGRGQFRNLSLSVNPSVLIPRPETEVLVDLVLKIGDEFGRSIHLLDVGTGSGAIAIAIKSERPKWEVHASDISKRALAVAKKNADRIGCPIHWLHSSLLKKFSGKAFDIIVSNPPYVNPEKDKVAKDVDKFEPHLALYPEKKFQNKMLKERGAWVADKIIAAVAEGKVSAKYLAFELSPRVAAVLEKRWKKNPQITHIARERDLAGRARFLLIAWKNYGPF